MQTHAASYATAAGWLMNVNSGLINNTSSWLLFPTNELSWLLQLWVELKYYFVHTTEWSCKQKYTVNYSNNTSNENQNKKFSHSGWKYTYYYIQSSQTDITAKHHHHHQQKQNESCYEYEGCQTKEWNEPLTLPMPYKAVEWPENQPKKRRSSIHVCARKTSYTNTFYIIE